MRSWVVGLLAVLDSAALYLALSPEGAPSEARLCLRMGFTSLREVARIARIPYDPDPDPEDPIRLSRAEFDEGVQRIAEPGFPLERSAEEAWAHFRGWRINYEAIAYALADRVIAVPGPWSGPRRHIHQKLDVRRPVDRKPKKT